MGYNQVAGYSKTLALTVQVLCKCVYYHRKGVKGTICHLPGSLLWASYTLTHLLTRKPKLGHQPKVTQVVKGRSGVSISSPSPGTRLLSNTELSTFTYPCVPDTTGGKRPRMLDLVRLLSVLLTQVPDTYLHKKELKEYMLGAVRRFIK